MTDKQPAPERRPGLFRRMTAPVRGVGRAYVRAQFGDVKGFVEDQKSFGSWLIRYLRRDPSRRQETFEDAMRRLGLTDGDLAAKQTSLVKMAWVYGSVAAVAFVLLTLSPIVSHPISQFLLSLGVFTVSGTRCAATRFRVAQIRSRKFLGFGEWIRGHG